MKAGALLLLNLAVSVPVAAAAVVLLRPAAVEAPLSTPPAPAPSLDPERVRRLEARLDEMAAAIEGLRKEAEEARTRAAEAEAGLAKEKERANAAEVLLAGYAGAEAAPRRPAEMDAFAKEVSKAMKQGIRLEFRRISDLVVNPSPEALEQRRRQLKMFSAMMGTAAGLDQAQVAVFETILNETDEKAREDLRPLLQGVEDYRKVDYPAVRKVTEDSFAAQDAKIDREFPKDKSERLKQQLEPVRNLFGAMLGELEKEAAAAGSDAPK